MSARPGILLILAVNAGNTTTTAALLAGRRIVRRSSMPTAKTSAAAVRRLLTGLRVGRASGAAMASVVPAVDAVWLRELERICGDRVVRVCAACDIGVALKYPEPRTLGADRLANLVGAAAAGGGPAIVVDAGTATTFDAIDARGAFIGGVIAPGPEAMIGCLADWTAKLPRLAFAPDRGRLGRSTEQAMRIGAAAGFAGMVKGILERMRRDRRLRSARVIACGGAAALVRAAEASAQVDADLTLRGVAELYARNGRRARARVGENKQA